MLLKELLLKNNIQQKQLAVYLGIDKEHISKIANYKCLPTPEQLKKICEFLNCNILDIYNKNEISLIFDSRKANRNKNDNLYYRLSVRLNKCSCNCLKQENLKRLGYKTLKEWVESCVFQLEKELNYIGDKTMININKSNSEKDILDQKHITTLGDMINLMNNGSKSFNPCRTYAKVIDSPELKKEYLKGFILGVYEGQGSKLSSAISDFKNLIQSLYNNSKIDKYELNAINDIFNKIIKQIIEYLSKSNLVVIEF